jgi:hypothetical protein
MAITINNNSPRAQYIATGGETNFAGTWRIEAAADIKVYQAPIGSSPDDTADLLTLTTDYTITGIGVGNSFTVILNSGATAGDVVTIVGDIDFSATYNFLTNQDFDPDVFNEIFSKFDRELKQLRMETRNLQPKYQNSEQVIAKDYKLPQLAANQSWRMNTINDEIEAVELSPVSPGETWYGITSGTNTYTVTITDFVGYVTGEKIHINIGTTNTGASTININSLGTKNLLRSDGTPIIANDLKAGTVYDFIYTGTSYRLTGKQKATETSTGISQIATVAEVQAGTNDFKYVTPKKLREDHPGNVFFVDTSGAANVYTGTVSGLSSYTLGDTFNVRINTTNTGASTLNLNGIGAKQLLLPEDGLMRSGDLMQGNTYCFVYDGAAFRAIRTAGSEVFAWGRFLWDSVGGIGIIQSKGISSFERLSLGHYKANFTFNYDTAAGFSIFGSAHSNTNSLGVTFSNPIVNTPSSSQFNLFKYTDGTADDATVYASIMFVGFVIP